jgi:hypothetical protein
MGLKTWNMSLDKLVNIGPITQPSVGDNLLSASFVEH